MPEYDRRAAVEYARRWALGRNPAYMSLNGIGGDCTNFCSQCLYAGGCVMNYTPDFGWYYRSPEDRAAAWTGVTYLYEFLVGHNGPGPLAEEVLAEQTQPGDIIQLGRADGRWYHSMVVLQNDRRWGWDGILIAAHSIDSLDRPLSSYEFDRARGLHIVTTDAQA